MAQRNRGPDVGSRKPDAGAPEPTFHTLPAVHTPLRALDANLNRAREAARVMEDAARFLLDDAALAEGLKSIRHELTAAAELLPPLDGHRDTIGDVGAALTHAGERGRAGARGVAVAAGKRLGEALRSLEEFGKLVDEGFAGRMKSLRYRGYELESALVARLPARDAGTWRVCVLVTESLCRGRSWESIAEAAIAGGADAIQLREKSLPDAELLHRARRLVGLAAQRAAVVVNDRPDVAILANADAVHVGQDDLSIADVRHIVGRRLLVGASTHDLAEADAAVAAGADYCGVGAMFATATKPDRSATGAAFLARFVAAHPHVPHLAIGGVTPDNVATLVAAGCRGVAVGAGVCGADDPEEAVRRLRGVLEAAARDRCA